MVLASSIPWWYVMGMSVLHSSRQLISCKINRFTSNDAWENLGKDLIFLRNILNSRDVRCFKIKHLIHRYFSWGIRSRKTISQNYIYHFSFPVKCQNFMPAQSPKSGNIYFKIYEWRRYSSKQFLFQMPSSFNVTI
jgi:hypothetical protein